MSNHTAVLVFATIAIISWLLSHRRGNSLTAIAMFDLACFASAVLAGYGLLTPLVIGAA